MGHVTCHLKFWENVFWGCRSLGGVDLQYVLMNMFPASESILLDSFPWPFCFKRDKSHQATLSL